MSKRFSWRRLWAMVVKEFIQMRRDQATFSMLIGIPLVQLILFGFAINMDPKHLPTVVVSSDYSSFARNLVSGLQNSQYFDVKKTLSSEKEAKAYLKKGKAQFILNIPPGFSRSVVRGERPRVLLEADATDPATTGIAIGTAGVLSQNILNRYLQGPLEKFISQKPPFELIVHAAYNPTRNTQYNIVPGLIGVILMMTLVMVTAIAIVREKERGTIENILATPIQALEIILGKILPFIVVGYIQMLLVILLANLLFDIPMRGSLLLLLLTALPFIAANLSVGLMLSTISTNQLQAVQLGMFFFLPSILLSGFMFPFRGMPIWAQVIGEALPLTHFLRINRGILLKGNGIPEVWPEVWPILLFVLMTILIGLGKFRKTLD
jgi:ABC-2 type transport system permease protein